jgi:two-component sensor histidine kinase
MRAGWRTGVSRPGDLAGLRADVEQHARAAGVTDAPAVALAVHELVVNSMEHAYGWDASPVQVSLRGDDGHLTVAVHDDGAWLPQRDTPGRGLGLRLVRVLAADMSIRTGNDGSTVEFRVPRVAVAAQES